MPPKSRGGSSSRHRSSGGSAGGAGDPADELRAELRERLRAATRAGRNSTAPAPAPAQPAAQAEPPGTLPALQAAWKRLPEIASGILGPAPGTRGPAPATGARRIELDNAIRTLGRETALARQHLGASEDEVAAYCDLFADGPATAALLRLLAAAAREPLLAVPAIPAGALVLQMVGVLAGDMVIACAPLPPTSRGFAVLHFTRRMLRSQTLHGLSRRLAAAPAPLRAAAAGVPSRTSAHACSTTSVASALLGALAGLLGAAGEWSLALQLTQRQRERAAAEAEAFVADLQAALSSSGVTEHAARLLLTAWEALSQQQQPARARERAEALTVAADLHALARSLTQLLTNAHLPVFGASCVAEALSRPCLQHAVVVYGLAWLEEIDGRSPYGLSTALLQVPVTLEELWQRREEDAGGPAGPEGGPDGPEDEDPTSACHVSALRAMILALHPAAALWLWVVDGPSNAAARAAVRAAEAQAKQRIRAAGNGAGGGRGMGGGNGAGGSSGSEDTRTGGVGLLRRRGALELALRVARLIAAALLGAQLGRPLGLDRACWLGLRALVVADRLLPLEGLAPRDVPALQEWWRLALAGAGVVTGRSPDPATAAEQRRDVLRAAGLRWRAGARWRPAGDGRFLLDPTPSAELSAALAGGLLPSLEQPLRLGGSALEEAWTSLLGGLAEEGRPREEPFLVIAPVLVYGDVRQAASLIRSLGKRLRAIHGSACLARPWQPCRDPEQLLLILASRFLAGPYLAYGGCMGASAGGASAEGAAAGTEGTAAGPAAAAAAEGPGAGAAAAAAAATEGRLRLVLSLAAAEWFPALARVGEGTAGAAKLLGAASLQGLDWMAGGVPGIGAVIRPLGDTHFRRAAALYLAPLWAWLGPALASDPGGAVQAGSWRQLVLGEMRAVQVLGSLLLAAPEDGPSEGWPSLAQVALTCTALAGCCPRDFNASGKAQLWNRQRLREGARLFKPQNPNDAQLAEAVAEGAEALAAQLEAWGTAGEGGHSDWTQPNLDSATRAGALACAAWAQQQPMSRLVLSPGQAAASQGVPRWCGMGLACKNLSGDSEAGLELYGCTGCGGAVRYCGRECQRAHWRAGHREACGAARGKGG